jgi:hypothetical protein
MAKDLSLSVSLEHVSDVSDADRIERKGVLLWNQRSPFKYFLNIIIISKY